MDQSVLLSVINPDALLSLSEWVGRSYQEGYAGERVISIKFVISYNALAAACHRPIYNSVLLLLLP